MTKGEKTMQKNDRPMDIADVLARRKPQLIAKRAMDIVLSACALAVLWPLLLLIALAIWIDDPGPVFYRQVRVGRNGKTFRIFKFRSMVMDADKKGLAITVGRDSRITRVGAVLRKTKLDELAQLLNVILGQMSFVGPRPEVPKYVELYTPYQRQCCLCARALRITRPSPIATKTTCSPVRRIRRPCTSSRLCPIKSN